MWSVISLVRGWVDRHRAIRRRWQRDARSLIAQDERGAYYAAQRLAARSRALGERREFIHWAKVAAEVARLSPRWTWRRFARLLMTRWRNATEPTTADAWSATPAPIPHGPSSSAWPRSGCAPPEDGRPVPRLASRSDHRDAPIWRGRDMAPGAHCRCQ